MPITLTVSYTSVDLMVQVLPEIGSISTLQSKDIAVFAGQAETEINAKISKRYALPITSEIPLLQTLATDLGLYRLLTRRMFTADQLEDSPWPDRYKESMDTLDEIATGEIQLVTASGVVLGDRTDIQDVYSTTMNDVPTFYEGSFADNVRDPDKIDREDDRRD